MSRESAPRVQISAKVSLSHSSSEGASTIAGLLPSPSPPLKLGLGLLATGVSRICTNQVTCDRASAQHLAASKRATLTSFLNSSPLTSSPSSSSSTSPVPNAAPLRNTSPSSSVSDRD